MTKHRVRADDLLVSRGLVATRSQARALIMAGRVWLGDQRVEKAGELLPADAELRISEPPRYVSRGGEKLEHALRSFGIDVNGLVCADFGASTGGFTDVLLQHGARRVYAIDVGRGQLHYRLRHDPRVVVMERTNVRYLKTLPELIDLVTIDVSFISLRLVLPAAWKVLAPYGRVIALVKPQFEAGRGKVGKGGVVRDLAVHREVLERVTAAALDLGFSVEGLIRSPITGAEGNIEYFLLLRRNGVLRPDVSSLIDNVLREVETAA
ncbi:TlyA family RNA methyltransferase [Thermomicrobium roseum]|uniref:Hemolysin A n=1 Tax=Thermomicrobium roseum (strain ATCC 27502 / DSM 5159 / P-2) TaxID=309801 RepID=B9KZ88_THERP|nr:TlyA family RNA methyltransferase [Thermomicrobium roseum]ACM04897.1 hemolysin A [Thermomicrobium roseum DSM 5159]